MAKGQFRRGFEQKHKGGARVKVKVIQIGAGNKVCLKWGVEVSQPKQEPKKKEETK